MNKRDCIVRSAKLRYHAENPSPFPKHTICEHYPCTKAQDGGMSDVGRDELTGSVEEKKRLRSGENCLTRVRETGVV